MANNTGYSSTGYSSTGDRSTGHCSTGHCSTGHCSTGHYSTGHCSIGDYSTGNYSTGDYSTGNYSTGNYSTGNYSTGKRSTGDWSTSNFSTGHFSTVDYSGYGAFNKPCTPKEWHSAKKPDFLFFKLTEWISEDKMTNEEKEQNPTYKTTGGYLKVYEYKDAWRRSFEAQDNKEEQIKQLEALPNFDYDVFVQISGIDYRKEQQETITIGDATFNKKDVEEALKNIKRIN